MFLVFRFVFDWFGSLTMSNTVEIITGLCMLITVVIFLAIWSGVSCWVLYRWKSFSNPARSFVISTQHPVRTIDWFEASAQYHAAVQFDLLPRNLGGWFFIGCAHLNRAYKDDWSKLFGGGGLQHKYKRQVSIMLSYVYELFNVVGPEIYALPQNGGRFLSTETFAQNRLCPKWTTNQANRKVCTTE